MNLKIAFAILDAVLSFRQLALKTKFKVVESCCPEYLGQDLGGALVLKDPAIMP